MKKYIIIVVLLSIASSDKAQKKSVLDTIDTNEVYTAVENSANFPGGLEKFDKFISDSLRYSDKTKEWTGIIIATFIVERNGSLSDIKILRGSIVDANKEVLRVLKTSPKWIPGKQNGIVIRQQYTVPVHFGNVKD